MTAGVPPRASDRSPPPAAKAAGGARAFAVGLAGVALLAVASLFVGAGDLPLFSGDAAARLQALELIAASRVPRTLALLLAGVSLAIAGLLMQMIARNRFVEPSTVGTVESASLGVLAVMLLAPAWPPVARMLAAAAFALGGTALFLAILRRMPLRSPFIVPLIGLVLGGVISAATTFVAYRYEMLQSMNAWTTGDFSAVLRGRYELLWIAAALAAVAYVAADRFTAVGMGEDFAANIGLDHGRLVALGLVIVSMVTAAVVVTAGVIAFVGLVVPNVVSLFVGDHVRRAVPWVALAGAGFVLACDLLGRMVMHPYEVPIGTVAGVVGSVLFLGLLLRRRAAA